MKKKIAVCSFIISAVLYANDDGGIKLNESVISTGGFETTLEKTDKNINIITTKDIENQNFENITEALNGLPGITVFSNTFGSFVDLRGQGVSKAKSNVQILVDGVNINPLDPAHGVLPIDTIPIGNIERIEVIPGGGSIVYGDGAVGGVINIITKVESGVASNYLNSKVGSLEERKLELGTGHRFNDKVLVQLDYSGASTDGYRDGNDAEKHFVQGTVNYKINDSNKIILKYSRAEEDSKSPSMLTREQLNEDRRGSGEVNPWDSPSQSELTRDLIALNYKSNLSEKLSLNLDINYQNTENRWSSQMEVYQMPTFTSKAQESVGVFHDKKFVFSPKLKYEYANGEIIGGIDYKDMEAKRIGEPGYLGMYLDYDAIFSKKSLAAFILNRYSYRNWDFTQGYRRERSEYKTGRSLSLYTFGPPLEMGANPTVRSSSNFKNSREMENDAYELGFNYRYSDTGNIYTRGEFGFRTPAPSELIDKPQDKTLGYLENSLEAERFKNFEIGLKDAYKNMFFSLTLFHTLTEDEILQIGSMPTWWEFINMGKTERTGVELSSEQYFGKLTLSQGFTLVEAKIKSGEYSGNYIPGVSKYSLNVKGTYDFTEKLSTTLSATYKDGYYLDQSNLSGEVNSYIVTGLDINYKFNEELKIYAGINNLFNEKYYNSVSKSSSSSDGKVYDPAAERRFYTGFDYKF